MREAQTFAERVERELGEALLLDGQPLKAKLNALVVLAQEFMRRISKRDDAQYSSLEELNTKKAALEQELGQLSGEEERVHKAVEHLRRAIESEKDLSRDAERELFEAMARRSELEVVLAKLAGRAELLAREGVNVVAMLSIESVGYYTDANGSQDSDWAKPMRW